MMRLTTILKFFKRKPAIHKAPTITLEQPSRPGSHLTIKEAVYRVLEFEQKGMTIEQIYNKIVADGLYTFGAQNPLNVVRVEIERACENSNYTICASKKCFRFEKNQNGEKIYFLLSSTPANETGQPSINVNGGPIEPREVKKEPSISNIEIWNDSVERSFQIWMESENYTPSTARNYCSAVNRTVQNFRSLLDISASESITEIEAVRKFVALLNQNSEFVVANSTAHHQYSASLSALARFFDSNTAAVVAGSNTAKNDTFVSEVEMILSTHFPNGFRLESPIELLRFRGFATEDFGNKIALSDEELKQSISISGTFFDGKVYIVLFETEERIKKEVDTAFKSGMEIIFYEAFYEKHEDWLFPASVISVEMMKSIFLKICSKYTHRGNYLTNNKKGGTELEKIESEIVRVWGDCVLKNYGQLAEGLPYIPSEKIKYVLVYNADFIWNSVGVYTHVSRINITKEESAKIVDFAVKCCCADGYVSLSDLPLNEVEENNYELTLTAIHNAVFRLCLSDNFDKKGKIVTRKGDKLDALTIMKKYCSTVDKCTLDDLFEFEKDLTGEVHRLIPMEAGYDVLVRTDKNAYVSEKYISFDRAAIDSAIEMFVIEEYLPLRGFTTFAAFPHCGQAWNLYLLESYCRRFSEQFRLEVLSLNSKNTGVVVRKNYNLSYAGIMADAVAKSGIALEKAVVEDFLCSNGYLGRRSYAKTHELIEQVKTIRETRE